MKWFSAKALADNPRAAHIVIDKPIGSDWAPDWISDFTGEQPARDFIDAVDALGELDTIDLELNSPGGDVASGIRIMNYLRNHPATVNIRVTGMAASIATVVMMAGDTRTMGVGATIMTHRASSLMVGFYSAKEMEEHARNLSTIDNALVDAYVSATGKTAEEINGLLDQGDTYMGADEAIEWGFATDKDAKLKAVACADPRMFMKQIEQQGQINQLQAKLDAKSSPAGAQAMTARDALALAFDLTPEQADEQAADLGDLVMALRQPTEASLRESHPELIEQIEAQAKASIDLSAQTQAAVTSERSRVVAIAKACQTTGQNQLLEKLIDNGMAEAQASEYIYDVAAASGNKYAINGNHSPEGGHKAGIDHNAIYNRRNRKTTA